MQPSKDLGRLERAARRRLARLKSLILMYAPGAEVRQRQALVASTTIEIHSTWTNFARAFYLSCAFWTRTTVGAQVRSASRAVGVADAVGRGM